MSKRMSKRILATCMLTAASLILAAGPAAQAASIGVNFTNDSNLLNAATTAGATPATQANWNNGVYNANADGTLSTLIDNTGATVSGISVSWNGAWSNSGRTGGFTGGDVTLYTRYLACGGPGATVTVTDIPYAEYEVYVYVTGNDTYNRAGGAWLSNVSGETGGLNTDEYYYQVTNSGGYQLSTQTTPPANVYDESQYQLANYIVFSGNTANGFVLTADDNMGTWNVDVGIAGIQIVEVPEPVTMSLLLCGGLGMLLPRRKRAHA